MAPASCKTWMAQPRRLRIGGRSSFVISIEITPAWDESFRPPVRSQRLARVRDSRLARLGLVHLFRGAARMSECQAAGLPAGSAQGKISVSLRGLMGKPEEPYIRVIAETYRESGTGLHGDLHVRPIAGQGISRKAASATGCVLPVAEACSFASWERKYSIPR